MTEPRHLEIGFQPIITLSRQPDGSYVAEVDWADSLVYATDDTGEEIDDRDEQPEVIAACKAIDQLIGRSAAHRGFIVPAPTD